MEIQRSLVYQEQMEPAIAIIMLVSQTALSTHKVVQTTSRIQQE
jgi:hypothetical protein